MVGVNGFYIGKLQGCPYDQCALIDVKFRCMLSQSISFPRRSMGTSMDDSHWVTAYSCRNLLCIHQWLIDQSVEYHGIQSLTFLKA
jgi:hypothetical protein